MLESVNDSPSAIKIPQKKYLKIGETSNLLGIKPHVLRYWESEFPQIKPVKSRTGQRMYRHQDVVALIQIQDLLYRQKFTIKGAREAMKAEKRGGESKSPHATPSKGAPSKSQTAGNRVPPVEPVVTQPPLPPHPNPDPGGGGTGGTGGDEDPGMVLSGARQALLDAKMAFEGILTQLNSVSGK